MLLENGNSPSCKFYQGITGDVAGQIVNESDLTCTTSASSVLLIPATLLGMKPQDVTGDLNMKIVSFACWGALGFVLLKSFR